MLIKTDDLGVPRFSNRDLTDMIYSGHVDKCHVVLCDPSDDIDKFNAAMQDQHLPELTKYIALDVDQKTFDGALQSEWFMPDEYKDINVYEYVLGKAEIPEGVLRRIVIDAIGRAYRNPEGEARAALAMQ